MKMYALVFLVTALGMLTVLGLVPSRGALAINSRLEALEAATSGLAPIAGSRIWNVLNRRKAAARRKRMVNGLKAGAKGALAAIAGGGAAALAFHFFGTPVVLTGLSLACGIGLAVLPACMIARVRRLNQQIPLALGLLAANLGRLNSFFGAIDALAISAPQPLRGEFRRISAALRANATIEQALFNFTRRNPSPDAYLLARLLCAPQHAGPIALVPALLQSQELLSTYRDCESKVWRWRLLKSAWLFSLAVSVVASALRGFLRPDRPLLVTAALGALALLGMLAWWLVRKRLQERGRLEARLSGLGLGVSPDSNSEKLASATRGRGTGPKATLLRWLLVLDAWEGHCPQSLSNAATRALCHFACLLRVGLSLESAIGAVVLRPGAQGRLERELFGMLQEVRSGRTAHAAALALASRCKVPEFHALATALLPDVETVPAMESAARSSLAAWPQRVQAASLATATLATGATGALLVPLLGLCFAP